MIDTHAHYNTKQFNKDRHEILNKIQKECELVINVGTNSQSFKDILKLAKSYNFLYSIIGYFPCDVLELENPKNKQYFLDCLKEDKVIGIGEIGLDYHWNTPSKEIQKKYFIEQLTLAKEFGLPVSIHSRDAEKDTLKIIIDNFDERLKGVIHCYSYGLESALKYLEMGFYFGIGGTSTYNNNNTKDVIKNIPLQNLLLETDCPYLSPVPNRGKRNDSSNLIFIAKNIANIKEISIEKVIEQTDLNAKKLYNI